MASDIIGFARNLTNSGFSRGLETEADLISLEALTDEDSRKLVTEVLANLRDGGGVGGGPFSSHPTLDHRIAIVRSYRKEDYSNGNYEHRDSSGKLIATLKLNRKSTYTNRGTDVVKFWVGVNLIEDCPPMKKPSAFQNAARVEFFDGLVFPQFGKQAKYRPNEKLNLQRGADLRLSFWGEFHAPNELPEAMLWNTHGCSMDFKLAKSE